jgi:hypothetical protein
LPPESRRQSVSSCAQNCCCARRGEAKSGRSQEDSPCTRTADSPEQPKRLRQNQKLRSSRKMSGSSSRFFLLSRDSLSCRQLDGGDGCTPSSQVSTVDQPAPAVSLCQRRRYHGRNGEVERQLDPRFVGRACEAVNQPEEYRTTLHLFRIAELKKPPRAQQTCTHSIPSKAANLFNLLAICPTPTAQWWAGPWTFH